MDTWFASSLFVRIFGDSPVDVFVNSALIAVLIYFSLAPCRTPNRRYHYQYLSVISQNWPKVTFRDNAAQAIISATTKHTNLLLSTAIRAA